MSHDGPSASFSNPIIHSPSGYSLLDCKHIDIVLELECWSLFLAVCLVDVTYDEAISGPLFITSRHPPHHWPGASSQSSWVNQHWSRSDPSPRVLRVQVSKVEAKHPLVTILECPIIINLRPRCSESLRHRCDHWIKQAVGSEGPCHPPKPHWVFAPSSSSGDAGLRFSKSLLLSFSNALCWRK